MIRRKSAIALVVALVFAAAAIFIGVNRFRYRFVRSDEDLLRFLPQGDGTLFFANVAALRHAGYLRLFENTKQQRENDYAEFVQQTGFDYTKDLDSLAGGANGHRIVIVLRGRFHWTELEQYAKKHGGSCDGSSCSMAAITKGRWISFRSIQPDAIALAVSEQARGVTSVHRAAQGFGLLSDAPVWLRPSREVLSSPAELPLPLRIVALSLQSSDSVVLSFRGSETRGVAFSIQIDAACANAATAETARTQLQLNTSLLKQELAREHQKPNPADLTGLLTAGTFGVVQKHLVGSWPVSNELLAALE